MTLPQNPEHRFIDEVRRKEGHMAEDYGFLNTYVPWEILTLARDIDRRRTADRVFVLRTMTVRAARSRFALDAGAEQALCTMLNGVSDRQLLESAFDAAVLAANRADFDARVRALLGDRNAELR